MRFVEYTIAYDGQHESYEYLLEIYDNMSVRPLDYTQQAKYS